MKKVKVSVTLDYPVWDKCQKLRKRAGARSDSSFINWILRNLIYNEVELARMRAKEAQRILQERLDTLSKIEESKGTENEIQAPIYKALPPIRAW